MADIKVSELTETSTLNDNDLFMIVQSGVNKKIKKSNLHLSTDYSTSEVDTGQKWIDGKTIYRKVLTGTPPSSGEEINIDMGTTIETIVYSQGFLIYSDTIAPMVGGEFTTHFVYKPNTNKIRMWTDQASALANSYIIITEYTKSSS